MPYRRAGLLLASVVLVSCANLSALTGGSGDAGAESGGDASGNVVCVAGRSLACTGPGGCTGGQACNATGTAYEACLCESRDGEAPMPESGTSDGSPARDAAAVAPVLIQSHTLALASSTSTATLSLDSAVGATDSLILPVVNYSTTNYVASISGGGGTWVKAIGPLSNDAQTGTGEIWYAPNVSGGTEAVTVTFSATLATDPSGFSGVAVLTEWRGLGAIPLDVATSNEGALMTSFSSPPITPNGPHELFIALTVTQRYGADLVYGSWSELGELSSTSTGYADAVYLVASGAGAQTVAGTQGSGDGESWELLIAGFN